MKVTGPLFEDKDGKDLQKQIQGLQSHFYKELDKAITLKTLLAIAEMGILPILEYPERIHQDSMPLTYSKKRGASLHANVPIPEVKLYTIDTWVKPSSIDHEGDQKAEFHHLLDEFKKNVKRRMEI